MCLQKEVQMNKQEKALNLYHSGFNCSQAVVAAFSEDLNIDEKMALKLASGFGSGMRCGDMCGAITGALMILGLIDGQEVATDQETKKQMGLRVDQFHEHFINRHGANRCIDLLDYDMRLPDSKIPVEKKQLKRVKCDSYVKDAVAIVEKMIND